MEKEEILQLAYIKVAQAAQLLQKAGEELLAEEAEELAKKVDLAVSMHAPSLPLSGFGPRPFRTAHLGISWVQPPRQLLAIRQQAEDMEFRSKRERTSQGNSGFDQASPSTREGSPRRIADSKLV
jgi:hypothetical protein